MELKDTSVASQTDKTVVKSKLRKGAGAFHSTEKPIPQYDIPKEPAKQPEQSPTEEEEEDEMTRLMRELIEDGTIETNDDKCARLVNGQHYERMEKAFKDNMCAEEQPSEAMMQKLFEAMVMQGGTMHDSSFGKDDLHNHTYSDIEDEEEEAGQSPLLVLPAKLL